MGLTAFQARRRAEAKRGVREQEEVAETEQRKEEEVKRQAKRQPKQDQQ